MDRFAVCRPQPATRAPDAGRVVAATGLRHPRRTRVSGRSSLARVLAGLTTLAFAAPSALALDEKEGEKAALKVCERKFCDIVLAKDVKKPADFQCGLSKTWAKRKIKDSVDGKTSAWSLGDARCSASLGLARGLILQAMTAGKHMVEFDPHTVHCEVENEGSVTRIDVTLAPKIEFKDGKASKAWIKLKKVDGPGTWKATLWTLAKVEDTFGLFQKDVLKAINKLVHETCPGTYGAETTTSTPAAAPAPAKAATPTAKPTAAKPEAPDATAAKATTATKPTPAASQAGSPAHPAPAQAAPTQSAPAAEGATRPGS